MEMRKLTVNIPVEMYDDLEQLARAQDLTVSQLVRRLLKAGRTLYDREEEK